MNPIPFPEWFRVLCVPLVWEPQEVYEPLDSPAWPKPHRSQFPSGKKNPKSSFPKGNVFMFVNLLQWPGSSCWELLPWSVAILFLGLCRGLPGSLYCEAFQASSGRLPEPNTVENTAVMSVCMGQPLWFWGVNSCRTPSSVWAFCTIPLGTGPSLYADGILVPPSLAQNPLMSPALTQHWPWIR